VKILVVDDERAVRESLRRALELEGYEIELADDGIAALEALEANGEPDAMILDILMPGLDGLEVARRLRREGSRLPILMLTARVEVDDRVAGLDAGADDYVTKPFGTEELLARIRAALRRTEPSTAAAAPTIVVGNLTIDRERRRVVRGDVEIRLTPKEFELLVLLAQQSGRVVTHRSILKAIWGPHSVDQPEHLRVLVGALRKKIEPDPSRPQYVLTEPWVGYRFNDAS